MVDLLRTSQIVFFDYLLDQSEDGLNLIIDDERVGARKRMDIYHHAYRASLSGVLSDHYERLKSYIGDEQFDIIALAYIKEHPSKVKNLRYYGEGFASFLAEKFPDDIQVSELARLDWHIRSAFDAADCTPLDANQIGLEGDHWVETQLTLHPSASLIKVTSNVVALWTALENESELPEPTEFEVEIPILVWRKAFKSQFRSVENQEAQALEFLAKNKSFVELSGFLAEKYEYEFALERLAAWLQLWLSDGLLIRN